MPAAMSFDTTASLFLLSLYSIDERTTMKQMHWILTSLFLATLLVTGCNKSGSVNPAPIEKSFASSDASLKAAADKAVAAIQSADYSGAMAELQRLAANVNLTDEQKKAVADVLAQVQKAVADMGKKATGEAGKAMDDVKKSLGK
jgi:hypothetical protein